MRHIGILAHSAEGAALCFLAACHEGEARLGAHDHPPISLVIAPMQASMAHWQALELAPIRMLFADTVRRLAVSGAEFFVCPDNTAHLALEADGEALALPGLHIAEVVAESAKARGFGRIGLLGTTWTMEGAVYPAAFARRGLEQRVPSADERADINAIIFDELVRGDFRETSRTRVTAMIENLQRAGCDAVALCCTEIPLLIGEKDSPLPILDSTRLLAKAAVAVALGEAPLPSWRGGRVA